MVYRSVLLLAFSAIVSVYALAPPKQHAVVVGAGPVGVAAALALASHHNYTVTLLESSPPASDQTRYDPTKAFLYNVNVRGQKFTAQFPNLQRKLEERSVVSAGFGETRIQIVPADPDEALPTVKKNMEGTTSSSQQSKTKKKEKKQGAMGSEKAVGVGYWIPRHDMVKLMAECVEEHNAKDKKGCQITFLMGQECVDVAPSETSSIGGNDGSSRPCVGVTTRSVADGSTATHEATLVVGADGMNSKVRECLASSPSGTWHSHNGFRPERFRLKQWTSPASHLRIKVLQLPPQFEIPNAGGEPPLVTTSEEIYALRSVHNGPRNYMSLGLLPLKDNTAVRPTNIVTRPDHEMWKVKDGPSMRRYFQTAFPRFDFATMISDKEWDRFAKAEGTRFPHCQYSKGLAVWDDSGTCGVALVGDAIHAFPPDIGQGVNAGLMDVVSLDRALQGLDPETGKKVAVSSSSTKDGAEDASLKGNLERYQRQHKDEIASLIRLARFGAPYQYNQPHRADRFLKKLWMANVAFRLILSKLTFGLVPPSCIILSQNADLTFRQVMRRSDLATAVFRTLVMGALGVWANRRFAPFG